MDSSLFAYVNLLIYCTIIQCATYHLMYTSPHHLKKKPDTSENGGMDPGGYVKVKCVASGHRSER